MSDMPRCPLSELQTPASLSMRSPVKAPSSSGKVTAMEEEEQQNENCPNLTIKSRNQGQDKYSFIASLDDQLDDVKWEERTTVITAIDHQAYLATAEQIVQDIMETVVDSETESSVNTSFSSAIRMADSDSEYESAVESVGIVAAEELVEEILGQLEIGNLENIMDVVRNEVENSQDTTITCTPSKEQAEEDREDTVTPIVPPVSAQFLMAYRGTGASEDIMTPDRGFGRGGLAGLATPAGTPQPGGRRQTLGSLSDCFNKIRLGSGESDEDLQHPVVKQLQLRPAVHLPQHVVAAPSSTPSISTPADLPRLLPSSPLPPCKAPSSPPPPEFAGAKRYLFDSPAIPTAGAPKLQNQEKTTEEQDYSTEAPSPVAKGYNLDFLDNLDDPNFNPFETKTGIVDKFAVTEPAAPKLNVMEEDSNPCDVKSLEGGNTTNAVGVCSPQLQNQEITAKKEESDLPLELMESPVPVAKGYNMDFLDKIDDPNFNPFETKTGIKENFAVTVPATSQTNVVDEDSPCNDKPKKEGGKTRPALKRFQKKVIPKTPLRSTTPNADNLSPAPALFQLSNELESDSQDPVENNYTPLVNDISNHVISPVKNENITETENSDLLTTRSIKIDPDQFSNGCEQMPSSSSAPKSKGYNLDFLEMCDDPNFNPFETKTNVVNDAQKTENIALNCSNSSANFEDDKNPRLKLSQEAATNSPYDTSKQLPSPPKLSAVTKSDMDSLEDETMSSASPALSPPTVPATGYNLDFLENCDDDPDFDPFITKTKITNILNSPPFPTQPIPTIIEAEADRQLPPPAPLDRYQDDLQQSATPKTVKFCEDPPTKISPKPFLETSSEDRIEFLLNKIKSLKQATDDAASSPLSQSDCSFSLPSTLTIPDLPASPTQSLISPSVMAMDYTMDTTCSMLDQDRSVLASQGGDLLVSNLSSKEQQMSILASQGGDLPIAPGNVEASSIMENSSLPNMTSENLSHLVLQHEARLLEKDKQLATVGHQMLERQGEIEKLRWEVTSSEESNGQMMGIVGEFEMTIGQLIKEKERENICCQIEREKTEEERNQILEDLQAVERAFKDLHKKYERTKEVIGGFKSNEDVLKTTVSGLCSRFKKGEERYELLKTHAETKLGEANTRLGEVKRSRASEIAKLTALLRKSEMGVASLEREVEQKNRENQELTTICDELISKVGC